MKKLFPRGDCFKNAVEVYSRKSETVRLLGVAYHSLMDAGVDLETVHPVLRELRIELANFHLRTNTPISLKGANPTDLYRFRHLAASEVA